MNTDFAWDFDGTLCDSYPFVLHCFKSALADYGITDDDATILSQLTKSVTIAYQYYHEHYQAPLEMMEAFKEYDRHPDFSLVTPYPQVIEALKQVIANGGRNMLFTHRGELVWSYLDHYSMSQYFSASVIGDEEFKRKPAPDGLLLLMKKSGAKNDNLIMVGDRSIDIDSAWNAGCRSCFYNSNHLAIPEHATWHVDSYAEFLKVFG